MIDPLTVILIGAGVLTFREMNRKDYGVLTPSRDERYRNAMEYCHQPDQLLEEAKLFHEYGLKAQAAMLKRRAEWRSRPDELKKEHEAIYKKAMESDKIPAILAVAEAFEGWTATKKAANLRERVSVLQEKSLQEAAQRASEAVKKGNGAGKPHAEPFTGVIDTTIGDDDT
jgi:hypothetical protein